MTTKQNIKGITPKGVATWPHLQTPDEYLGKKKYKTNLTLSEEDSAELIEKIDAATEAAMAETLVKLEKALTEAKTGEQKKKAKDAIAKVNKVVPYANAVDDNGDETGSFVFKFSCNAEYKDKKIEGKMNPFKLPMFDAKGNPTKANPWGGSVLRLAYEISPYYVAGTGGVGVTLRLSGVKVIELVTGGGGRSADALGFGEAEEGFEADLTSTDDGEDSTSSDDEDF